MKTGDKIVYLHGDIEEEGIIFAIFDKNTVIIEDNENNKYLISKNPKNKQWMVETKFAK